MKSLDKKLFRDLWHMKGQAFAIILVIMSGVSTFVMFVSVMDSLNLTRDRFYDEHGFADLFAPLKRAPGEEAQEPAPAEVDEDQARSPASTLRMRPRARCRLLFTVPRLIPRVWAISARLMSW